MKKRNACFPGWQRSVALQYTCIYKDLQADSVQDINGLRTVHKYKIFISFINIDMQFHIIIYTLNEIAKSKIPYKPIYTGVFKQFSLWKFMRYFTKLHSMY